MASVLPRPPSGFRNAASQSSSTPWIAHRSGFKTNCSILGVRSGCPGSRSSGCGDGAESPSASVATPGGGVAFWLGDRPPSPSGVVPGTTPPWPPRPALAFAALPVMAAVPLVGAGRLANARRRRRGSTGSVSGAALDKVSGALEASVAKEGALRVACVACAARRGLKMGVVPVSLWRRGSAMGSWGACKTRPRVCHHFSCGQC
jgi:hypothetical protein